MMESKGRGVLDTPLEPVIGLAEAETRWRGMTVVFWATPSLARTEPPRANARPRTFYGFPSPQTPLDYPQRP